MFLPLSKTRSLVQWLTPLVGCEKCHYAYEREPGYFLPATWMVHCFSVLGLGTALAFTAEWLWDFNTPTLIAVACVPSLLFSFLFARHSKAIYLALDHWIDPPRYRRKALQPQKLSDLNSELSRNKLSPDE